MMALKGKMNGDEVHFLRECPPIHISTPSMAGLSLTTKAALAAVPVALAAGALAYVFLGSKKERYVPAFLLHLMAFILLILTLSIPFYR